MQWAGSTVFADIMYPFFSAKVNFSGTDWKDIMWCRDPGRSLSCRGEEWWHRGGVGGTKTWFEKIAKTVHATVEDQTNRFVFLI